MMKSAQTFQADLSLLPKKRLMELRVTKHAVDSACKPTDWEIANRILYKMCRDYPKHQNKQVAIAKAWIIGRTYAAEIERGAPEAGPEFYEERVGQKMASRLDNIFNPLSSVRAIRDDNIPDLMKAYDATNKLFRDIAGKERRSLSSKYLHFHFPKLFYLYDSRAMGQIKQLTHSIGKKLPDNILADEYDPTYLRFFLRCWRLVQSIRQAYGISLTPRQLDNLLLKRDLEERKARKRKPGNHK